jgi:tetratricopeptide (TPR) repeat protein
MKHLKFLILVSGIVFIIPLQLITAQDHQHHQQGKVKFETSCSDAAQEKINTGLTLLHHMMYEQAEQEFAVAVKSNPDCAMAYWGIALSKIHPLWGERPSDADLKTGEAALAKAKQNKNITKREADYINALSLFYKNWENTTYSEQLKALESGFDRLHRSYPDDVDAAAFYALAHLATAPKNDKTFAHQKKAGKLLENLHEENPDHPGLFHYIIHAYDNPLLARQALEIAKAYDKIAPDVPHALHMPSHIFVRLGYWPDAVSWNLRSGNAALKQPVGDKTSMHYAHALDYIIYSYLQQGQDGKAQEVVNTIAKVSDFQPSFVSAYALAAVPARYYLERGDWTNAAKLKVHQRASFPWDKYPGAEALTHFARGLGAARSGNIKDANESVTALDKLHSQLENSGDIYWAQQVAVQRKSVKAWIAYANGKKEQALQLMREAADQDDALDKHPVTPGAILPARELLGDMLLLTNKPKDAVIAYESCLEISPNRFNCLYGAARSADLIKDKKKAQQYYSTINEMTRESDATRPSIKQARKNINK